MKTVGFFGGKFLPFHLGHVYATIEASNHVDKLYVVLASNEKLDRELCKEAGMSYIPVRERLSWMGETLKDLENIHILSVNDYGWEDGAKKITDAIPEKITHIFSSEESYGEYFNKYYPYADHIVIDNSRNTVKVSATEMRKDIYKYWEMIPNCARSYFVKKVCIIGTESCGKSTLTKKLAKFYNTNFVHEVGRDYCEKYKNQLTRNHFDSLAMDHWRLQETMAETSNKILFIDSDAVITQYYAELYNFKKSNLIEEIVKKQDYDLYLYLEPDIKWVDDGLREHGEYHIRMKHNKHLKRMFKERKIRFISINGSYSHRFYCARASVDPLIIIRR